MAKKSQPSKGQTGRRSGDSKPSKGSHIGDSKGSIKRYRKAMEIPPKTGYGSSSDSKKSKD